VVVSGVIVNVVRRFFSSMQVGQHALRAPSLKPHDQVGNISRAALLVQHGSSAN